MNYCCVWRAAPGFVRVCWISWIYFVAPYVKKEGYSVIQQRASDTSLYWEVSGIPITAILLMGWEWVRMYPTTNNTLIKLWCLWRDEIIAWENRVYNASLYWEVSGIPGTTILLMGESVWMHVWGNTLSYTNFQLRLINVYTNMLILFTKTSSCKDPGSHMTRTKQNRKKLPHPFEYI